MIRALADIGTVAVVIVSMAAFGQVDGSTRNSRLLVYFGTYTGPKSKGIYVSRFDAASGELSDPTLAAETQNPSFLAAHPRLRFLYSVNEIDEYRGIPSGAATAFRIDPSSGALVMLNQESSMGAGPAHLVLDAVGRNLLIANYGGGSVAVLPVATNGTLKPASAVVHHTGSSTNRDRQSRPHAHSVTLDAGNRLAYVADLGTDKVVVYQFDPQRGSLVPNDPPAASVDAGAGPRHFVIHPDGRVAYVINELNCTVTAFRRDSAGGGLTPFQTISTLPAGVSMTPEYSGAELQVHPSGRFLYASTRGHDSITVFAIDERSGGLSYVQNEPTGGRTPRGFGIDPGGTYLLAANQRSDSVVVFRIEKQTGRITATGRRIDVGSPVCVTFVR